LLTGDFRRQLETIDKIEWVTNVAQAELQSYLLQHKFITERIDTEESVFKGEEENIQLNFYHVASEKLFAKLFQTSCSNDFLY
jgi:DNA polymerase (family 10)